MLRTAKPRVVFLNLAGGKQEVLGAWLRERLDPCPGIVCTGAAVAFLAGTQAKIPVWADRSGLGWLMRCIYEPKKFIPRYWSALPLIGMVWAASRRGLRD
jgi:UDP-N-acetyl-D-mannosaminuronic acid transferase (WecB/TagA/CpsF family)